MDPRIGRFRIEDRESPGMVRMVIDAPAPVAEELLAYWRSLKPDHHQPPPTHRQSTSFGVSQRLPPGTKPWWVVREWMFFMGFWIATGAILVAACWRLCQRW